MGWVMGWVKMFSHGNNLLILLQVVVLASVSSIEADEENCWLEKMSAR